ncbi:protease pro-enzyme activation domain-containing protein [Amycolatopsis orientalis]|uniref:protease pro-enzyme activation domain-containing protein n=1 Tax=Amycolatopsis orientalis TaxID=31958 RepID=UPI0003A68B67|nr:protease pro-enzyme activation domain-containing protein [Amycolatopsis orientalis]
MGETSRRGSWSRPHRRPGDTGFGCRAGVADALGAHRLRPGLGAADTDREIPIALSLRPHDEAGLDQFVASVSDPRSPDYRHFLSSADYTARFAPLQSDVDTAKAYLEKQGLRVAGVSANRQVIDAVGTVGQVEAAFGTRLGDYSDSAGAHFYARESAPSVPSSLAGIVRTVAGLTNRPVAHRLRPAPAARAAVTPPSSSAPPTA